MAMEFKKIQIVCLTLIAFGFQQASALNPNFSPGYNFDLSHWYLQLPTANGVLTGTSGSVDSASTGQLVGGFTNSFFYTGSDGAMTFWVPDNGARTGGSSHPRSELRELLDPNNSGLNWALNGTHILSAQLKVLQVPADTGKVCIGQIHEPNTKPDGSASANNEQMIMFNLASQTIYANVNPDGDTNSSFSTTFLSGSSVKTNAIINYTISVVNGLLTIGINNVTNSWNLFSGTNYQGHVFANWDQASSNTVYFKAGDYNQTLNTCNCSNDGSQVAFYVLNVYHAPGITNQPTNFVGGVGGAATFRVGAIGNGTLSYQWVMNGTNYLAGATNASLALANLSIVNLGNYSVAVSDSTPGFNSITSSVAILSGTNFPPAITSQPVSQSVLAATNVIFSVGEVGTVPITNHWWFNTNTSLPWSTGNSITLTNVQNTNAGYYFVVVNNKFGAITSAVAVLSVSAPPIITNQPVSMRVGAGTNTTFAVGAIGAPPLNYGWWFNGTNQLSGATNAYLSLTNVSASNSGNYTVVINNSFGSVTSAAANLAVVVNVTFTNAGGTNWICPAGVTSVQVECWGGGGAGGSAQRTLTGNAFAGGGGGGAYARDNTFAVIPGTSYFISVGSGGVSSTNDLATVAGGDSWFSTSNSPSTVIWAKGGGGGQTVINLTNSGRVGTNGAATNLVSFGDVVFTGGNGGTGIASPTNVGGGGGGGAGDNGGGGNASSITNTAGLGGGGVFTVGSPGGDGVVGTGANGTNGFAPGGGGGGAKGSSANGVKIGGSGAAGQVILTYAATICSAALASVPFGNGSGAGGLAICPGQPITLFEIPAAGTAPFTYAWKKVGSLTVLGTSSNLVVSVAADGDQYACEVTSVCGSGTSLSPSVTLSVSGPGVVLSASTQTVYRTMSVSVTATLSGTATGGVWSTTGTGTFSARNSPATIYTPSATDAGTAVKLAFTTTQAGSCSSITATDTVTFSQTANPAKVVVIKADDFRGTNNASYQAAWNSFLQTSRALGVKVGIGVICTNNLDPSYALAQSANYQATTNWMRSQAAVGDVEFWNHAWIHTYWTNLIGQTIYEYSGSGLAAEQYFMTNSQAALSNALGHTASAFGSAYNQLDTNAATVINTTTALRLVFASSPDTIRSYGLSSRVGIVKIISESGGTGNPVASLFETAYPGGPTGPVALQFHPASFSSTNFLEYQLIIQYLLTNGYSILLPSEYVAMLPAITNQPANQYILAGSNATFTVGATGDPTLSYQWQFNGANRAGATAASLTVTNVQPASAGIYTVVVTNLSGVFTSVLAKLAIKVPPTITSAFLSNHTFQLQYSGTPGANYLLQAKSNLTDALWLPVSTNVIDVNGNYNFIDATVTNMPGRFYRLVAP